MPLVADELRDGGESRSAGATPAAGRASGGDVKALYDVLLLRQFREVRPPEEIGTGRRRE